MRPCLARICWGRSIGFFICSFVIQVISEKASCSKGITWKIIVARIAIDLVANLLLSSLCPFLQTENKNQVFQHICGPLTRNIKRVALYFKAMPNSKDFCKAILLNVVTICIMVLYSSGSFQLHSLAFFSFWRWT